MNIYFVPNDHTMRPRMEKNEKQVALLLKEGATEVFTALGQDHDGVVLYGRDLISADEEIKIRGYGPTPKDSQGVTRIFGPWRNQPGSRFVAYRYFLK